MRGKICDVISSLLSLEFWQHQWMVNAYGNTCFNQPFQRGFISKVRWCGPDTLGSTNGALSRSRSPCSDECEPGPETLQIQRDVIGEIQQMWVCPESSKGLYWWCLIGNVNESDSDMLGAPKVHYPNKIVFKRTWHVSARLSNSSNLQWPVMQLWML